MALIESRRRRVTEVVVLVAAIAVAGAAANILVPEAGRVPVKLLMLAVLVAVAHRGLGCTWAELGLDRTNLASGLRVGGVAAAAVALGVALAVAVPATRSLFEDSDVAADSVTQQLLMPIVIIPLGTALFEEIIFRGVLLGLLLSVTTLRSSVVVSSLLFGFWHLYPAFQDASGDGAAATLGIVVGTIAITSLAGVGFALLRTRSGSVAAPVLAHAALNSCAYVAAVIVT